MSNSRRILGVSLLFIVFPAVVWSAVQVGQLLTNQHPSHTVWGVFTLAILALLAAGVLLTSPPPRTDHGQTWLHLLLLGGLVLLALVLRLYRIEALPLGVWFDEALTGVDARRMWDDPRYQPLLSWHNVTYYHLRLHQFGLLIFGESSVLGLRLPGVLFGTGTVLLGYLVGREARDPWFGLGMAFFLAVPFWSLNFSRIAMTGIDAVFMALLALYFLLRVLHHGGAWRDVFFLAVALGLGVWFYTAFRFVVIALLIFALLKLRFWRFYWLRRGVVIAGVAALVTAPVLVFAQAQPDWYFRRTNEVSIFNENVQAGRTLEFIITQNAEAYAGMFHRRGDHNGRHNIPHEPLLDPVMGILMLAGMVLAVRWLHKESAAFYLLLLAALTTGILTIPNEAPNALRAIVALVPIAYFCTVALYSGAGLLRRWRWLAALIVIGVCGAVLVLNVRAYFVTFAEDREVFLAFSTHETVRGQIAAERQQDGYQIKLPNMLVNGLSQEFYAPDLRQQSNLVLNEPHPFPMAVEQPTTVLLDPDEQSALWQMAQAMHPGATFTALTLRDYGLDDDTPLLYVVDLLPDAADDGLNSAGMGAIFIPEYGDYQFYIPFGPVLLGGQVIESAEQVVRLPVGHHHLQLSFPTDDLYWRRPGAADWERVPLAYLHDDVGLAGQGFYGRFYKDDALLLERIDPTLYSYFHLPPLERPYEVVWSAWLDAPATGEYGFQLRVTGQAELWVNDERLMGGENVREDAFVFLPDRRHKIEVRFTDDRGGTRVYLRWRPPGDRDFTPIPPEVLSLG